MSVSEMFSEFLTNLQIRNELSFQERLELEAHYVRNWTIWWDLIILGNTAEVIIGRR